GLGDAVKYIPRPVVLGFTNGIALLIASTQIKDFLGLQIADPPSEFVARVVALAHGLHALTPSAVVLAIVSLLLIIGVPRVLPRVPGSIAALVVATGCVALLHLPVATIGSKFGGIPGGMPTFSVPAFRGDLMLPLLPSALTVAFLAAVESLLSAV